MKDKFKEELEKTISLLTSLKKAKTLESIKNSVRGFYYLFGITYWLEEISIIIFWIKRATEPTQFKLFLLSILLCLSYQTKLRVDNRLAYNDDYELMSEICEITYEQFDAECEAPKYVSEMDGAIVLSDEQGYREFCLLHGDPVYLMEFESIQDNTVVCRYVEIGRVRLRKSRGFILIEEKNDENF